MDNVKQDSEPLFPHNIFLILVGGCVVTLLFVVIYLVSATSKLSLQVQTSPRPTSATSPAPNGAGANWKTYRNTVTDLNFEFKYPSTLYPDKDFTNSQVFLKKVHASDAERIDHSDEIIEVRTDGFMDRFKRYYSAAVNTEIDGRLKVKNLTIGTYNAVEYTYIPITPPKGNVMMMQPSYSAGIIINRNGKIIEISTNVLLQSPEFKNTFDQILSTFRFLNQMTNASNSKLGCPILPLPSPPDKLT